MVGLTCFNVMIKSGEAHLGYAVCPHQRMFRRPAGKKQPHNLFRLNSLASARKIGLYAGPSRSESAFAQLQGVTHMAILFGRRVVGVAVTRPCGTSSVLTIRASKGPIRPDELRAAH